MDLPRPQPMGALHNASYGLLLGAIGQYLFWHSVLPGFPAVLLWLAVYLPWLVVFVTSFCKAAPFGPATFRRCLGFAMGHYAVACLLTEVGHAVIEGPAGGWVSFTMVRVFMYAGMLSFIVIGKYCTILRRIEEEEETARLLGYDDEPVT